MRVWLWTIGVVAGALAALMWPSAPGLVATGCVGSLAAAWRWHRVRAPLALALAVAFWASLVAAHTLSSRLTSPQAGVLGGCVVSGVWLDDGRVRFAFAATALDGRPVRWRLQLAAHDGVRVPRPGECWQFDARLRPPRGLLNFYGADSERRAFVAGLAARGTVRLDATAVRLRATRAAPLLQTRLALANRVRFAAGEGYAWPLLVALTVGLREPLPPVLNDVLTATGTRHLVSISGLHIGLAAALGFALARGLIAPLGRALSMRAWVRWCGDVRAGPCVALACALVYAALAGFALPTQRALVMLLAWLLAALSRRRVPLSTTLQCAVIALVLRQPLSVLDPGFYLSVGAVAALATLRLRREASVWRAQWLAFVGLWPVMAVSIGRLSLAGPLANAVWVPLFSVLLVPAALLGLALGYAPAPLACAWFGGLAALVQAALAWLWPLAAMPWASVALPQVHALALCLALPGVLLLLLPASGPRVCALAVTLCLPLGVARVERPDYGQLDVQVLDVAHGLAVALHTRHHTVLYDTGGRWANTDAGARVVVPQLLAHGTRHLHSVIVSHGDLDHRGGLDAVLAALPAGAVYAGEPQRGGLGVPCRAGQRWRLDGVEFAFVHPVRAGGWRGNNASCVLRVSARHGSVLLTGDLERLGELSLLHSGRVPRATVVIGQHHGSKTSSGQRFVRATSPELALFATAYDNRWNLPAAAVTTRWQSVGARTCTTGLAGAVSLRLDGRPVAASLAAARVARPALWRWLPTLERRGWISAFRVRTGRDILRASC